MPDRKLFRIEVAIIGTAYIKAKSRADASRIALEKLHDVALEVQDTGESHVEISGLHLSHPDLPEVSISPAMTVRGPFGVAEAAE